MKNVTVSVKGMSCAHCVSSIEGALQAIGVKAKVDLGQGTVDVAYDEAKVTLEAIKTEIEEQGYELAN